MAAGARAAWTGVRLLSLDCTGTLVEWSASLGTLYHRGFARGAPGVEVPSPQDIDARFPAAFSAVQREWPLYGRTAGVSSFDWWRAVARRAVEGSALAEEPEAFERGFAEVYRIFQTAEAYRVCDGVMPFLRWARQLPGLRICVISNSTGSYRDAVLPALGLDRYLDFGVYSKLVGLEKPDPAIFRLAAQLAGARPCEVLHVGKGARKDAAGARAAGCQALLLDRTGSAGPLPPGVDRVRSFDDVRRWLEARSAVAALGHRDLSHFM